jgi:hypothetical protein
VNGAAAVAEQNAALVPHACAPFSPASLINDAGSMSGLDCPGLCFRECRSVRAARCRVRTWIARKTRECRAVV